MGGLSVIQLLPSTTIADIHYNRDNERLMVSLSDRRTYEDVDVPPEVKTSFRSAFSKGVFFNGYIRDRYDFRKMAPPLAEIVPHGKASDRRKRRFTRPSSARYMCPVAGPSVRPQCAWPMASHSPACPGRPTDNPPENPETRGGCLTTVLPSALALPQWESLARPRHDTEKLCWSGQCVGVVPTFGTSSSAASPAPSA